MPEESYYFPEDQEMDLGDLLYFMRQENSSPGIRISAMTGKMDGMDYIMPMKPRAGSSECEGGRMDPDAGYDP